MGRFFERLLSSLYNLNNNDKERCLERNEAEHISEPKNGIFFMRNLKAEEHLRNSSKPIQNIEHKGLASINHTLVRGLARGQSPMQTAIDIAGRIDPVTKQRVGGLITLSDYDIGLINTAADYLQQLDKRYLALKLRNRQFDRTVKKSIETANPIPQERIDRIITAYSNNIIRRHGEIIARTETLKSINHTEYIGLKQAVDEGLINPNAIKKEWDDCGDKKVRHSHAMMAQKYGKGKGISIDEPFILPSGIKMLYPGDQSLGAPAKEIIQCRCRVHYDVDWFYGVE